MEQINPCVDIAFKKIFGVEENKDLLMSFINAIVSEEDQVADMTLLNPYNPKNFKNEKLSIMDIKAKGVDGKLFNIEVQVARENDYEKRALFYWGKLYTEQLQASKNYALLQKTIGIHILNFNFFPHEKTYHNVFHITEDKHHKKYFKDFELHTIELNKFSNDSKHLQENLSDLVAKIKNALDLWVTFLTRYDLLKKDPLPKAFNNPYLKKAIKVLNIMNFSEQEKEDYEGHLKWLRTEASALQFELEKGIEIGKEEGIKIEKQDIALKMLNQNLDIDFIVSITGLSKEAIENLNKFYKQ